MDIFDPGYCPECDGEGCKNCQCGSEWCRTALWADELCNICAQYNFRHA